MECGSLAAAFLRTGRKLQVERQEVLWRQRRERGSRTPNYLRAKRSKSAIWRSISSRAESAAERIPWMRSLNSSALEARARASSRVIESLHAVLAGAGGDGVVDQTRFVRVDDAIADVSGGDHDFDGGDTAFVIGAANEALRNDGFQRGGKLQANLFLLRRREDGDNTLNRFGGVQSVQGGKHEVAGFRGEQRGGNSFEVAHFADQNHVGVLTESSAQRRGKVRGVHFHFALIDEAFFVAVQKLDGIFDGDEMVGAIGVDAVDHRGQRGGLTGTGGSRNQHQPALFLADFSDDAGKI
jgi:hypothetical protein